MEPGYQNWLAPRQTARARTPESAVQIPPGLHLSARRGPEVELYDVTGVHLLASADSANPGGATPHNKRTNKWRSFLFGRHPSQSQGTSPVVLTNDKASEMKSAGPSDYTLGRLPTKASHGDSLNPVRQGCNTSFTNPAFNSYKLSLFDRCAHHSIENLPSEHRNYYKHCFTLIHHRAETSIILVLTLLISLAQSLFILLNTTFEQIGSTGLSFTALELGRLALFSLSGLLALFGIICVNWQCSSPSIQRRSQPVSGSSSLSSSSPKEVSGDSQRQMAYHLAHLLAAQRFDKRLRATYIAVYLSCLCLASAMLPWFTLSELSVASTESGAISTMWYKYNCTGTSIAFLNNSGSTNISNPLLHLTTWHIRASDALAPADSIWVVLWITVAVHGLLDLDRLWSRRLPYAFTVTLAVVHLILTNVFHMLTQSSPVLPSSRASSDAYSGACSSKDYPLSIFMMDRASWWDNPASLMGRQNLASLLALVAAHLVGQLLARWTVRHRYGLFILASHCQAKLDRLTTTEDKLIQLSKTLVPISLAKDLAQDFVAGKWIPFSSLTRALLLYLIYLNMTASALEEQCGNSVELVGLPTVASVVASASSGTVGCQQFVAFLNDIFGCFDRLARTEGCYRTRLNAIEYMCIAGYPETRVDHARSCVDFGLAMLKTVNELAQMTNMQLELRVAVHTGTAYAAVLGRSRLGFELTGTDVDFVSQLRQLANRPGRVLTSRATFGQLPEGFRGEPGPTVPFPGPTLTPSYDSPAVSTDHVTHMVDTFFVQPRVESATKSNGAIFFQVIDIQTTQCDQIPDDYGTSYWLTEKSNVF
ncbi:unnamed protein product [Echinostoma caproni]|uniref:adenylate cyclase n=1 Tax=Echinostoma caproni TaxID=27848 RepID=A0A183A8Y1_9TREM|nr:unnamed protein product [Echinostoma caproni]